MDDGNKQRLINSAEHRPVILFLGAGVMNGVIPLWETLLGKLAADAVDWYWGGTAHVPPRDTVKTALTNARLFSTYEQASLVKRLLGKQYLSVLRQALYAKYHEPAEHAGSTLWTALLNEHSFLRSVVELCRCRRVAAVVTYNFDDILPSAVQATKTPVTAPPRHVRVCSGSTTDQHMSAQSSCDDELPYYAVHGYLPNRSLPPVTAECDVILSQDEYLRSWLQPYAWQVATQEHFLTNNTCLFLGVSLSDMDMLRHLTCARSQQARSPSVFVLCTREEMCAKATANPPTACPEEREKCPIYNKDGLAGCKHADFLLRAKASLLDDVGVQMIVTDYYRDLPCVVEEITQELNGKKN
ncbi:MAG: SIR2 family protein [Armatimonadota bacterium]